MAKSVRQSVWLFLLVLLLALGSSLFIGSVSAAPCPADSEGTWSSGDWSCAGAARDCAIVNVCVDGGDRPSV